VAQASRWTLRPAADADLSDIWQRSAERWGVGQAERYIDGLFAVFDLLAEYPELARERPDFVPPVRVHPVGSHLVIYRVEDLTVEIIRVLHARQNLTAYLQES
jgi:toxin ParE1/3/4